MFFHRLLRVSGGVCVVALAASCAAGPRQGEADATAVPATPAAAASEAAPTTAPTAAPTNGSTTQVIVPVSSDLLAGVPVVDPDFVAQRDGVAEAAKTGSHPERLSPMIAPAPFDLAAYRRDPAAYLNTVEPGRAFQDSEAAPGIPPLRVLDLGPSTVPELGTTTVAIQTIPRAPATFTSLDMGAFANGLSSITVQADDQGVAKAAWTATRGTVAQTRILAASPLAVGTTTLLVTITSPDHSLPNANKDMP